jgi:phosphate-selective porin
MERKAVERMEEKTKAMCLSMSVLAAILLISPVGALAQETKEPPAVTAGKALKLSGYTQILYEAPDSGDGGFSIHRARLVLSGELFKNVRYKLQVDGLKSPMLLDANVEFFLHDAATVRVGQFKIPFGLEMLTSSGDLDTINRSQPVTNLSPGLDIGSAGRDIGAVVFGKTSILEYTVGVFNGAGINRTDTNKDKDWAGRLIVHPASFLALGASFYDGMYSPATGAESVKRDRAGFDAAVVTGPFSFTGEYIRASDGDVLKEGWYLQGGYYLLPKKLQGVVKVDSYNPDTTTDLSRSGLWTFGVNWFLAERTKLQIDLEITRDASGKTTRTALLAQFQAGF